MSAPSLPASRQLAYAVGQLGWSILVNVVGLTLVFFYLPPETAGIPNLITTTTWLGVVNAIVLIAASGRLLDAVTDPLVASWSDRSHNPRGRRVPFMAKGGLPAALFLVLMFWPPVREVSGWNIVWLVVVQALFFVALTVYVTPYFALLPELGHTARERLNLSTWISITYALGIIVAGSAPLLAGALEEGLGLAGPLEGLQAAVLLLGVVAVVCMYVPVFFVDERRYSDTRPTSVPMLPALRATLANRQFRLFVVSDFVYFTAITIILTGMLFYVTVLLEEAEALVAALLTVTVVASFLVYPLVNLLARKTGKKPLMVASFAAMAVVFANVVFLGRLPLSPLTQAYVLVLVYSIPLAFLGVLPNAVLADIAEWDAARTGEQKEGMFFAARTLMQKFGQTFGVLVFAGLTALGRDVGDDLGIRLSGVVGAAMCVMAAVVFSRYDERTVISEGEKAV